MSSTLLASPARSVDRGGDVLRPFNGRADASDDAFTSHVVVERDVCVVRVAGELDFSSAADAMRSCLDVDRLVVCVDLRELTFMDCGGYRGLVGARVELERRGGSLTLTGAVGEPARLLDLLGVSDGHVEARVAPVAP
jgi:anti-anti-sigma factor